jgi:hypothetical protein
MPNRKDREPPGGKLHGGVYGVNASPFETHWGIPDAAGRAENSSRMNASTAALLGRFAS